MILLLTWSSFVVYDTRSVSVSLINSHSCLVYLAVPSVLMSLRMLGNTGTCGSRLLIS